MAMRRVVSSQAPASLGPASVAAALEHQRHHDVVRHHDRQRHRFHDHHGGRRRQPADEGDERDQFGMGGDRQRQHEHVAVDLACRERQQAGHGDRHHEQIDEHQIERKQPGGAADLGLAVVLDHGDVELPRQQHDGEQRQHRHREKARRAAARASAPPRYWPGRARAANSATGPPNIQKVTKMPTARKATSLTIDSVAIASISPS